MKPRRLPLLACAFACVLSWLFALGCSAQQSYNACLFIESLVGSAVNGSMGVPVVHDSCPMPGAPSPVVSPGADDDAVTTCAADPSDNACIACVKEACCEELEDCRSDAVCTCLTMSAAPDQCGASSSAERTSETQDAAHAAALTCIQNNCGKECTE
jgi:hypothetical protein